MQPFTDALEKRVLVCDGAMGTMLYAKGVFINKSFDALNLTQPEIVLAVHQEYVRAGADILETNTFGANRIKLGSFGLAEKLHAINVEGVRIARRAAGERCLRRRVDRPARHPDRAVGQDGRRRGAPVLSRTGRGARRGRRRSVHPRDVPRSERNRRGHRRGARGRRPADRRADDDRGGRQHARRHAARALRSRARTARRDRDRRQLRRRSRADARDDRANGGGHQAAACRRSPTPASRRDVEGRNIYLCSPEYMASYARRFILHNVRVVGGCCGTTPEHIKQIKAAVRGLTPSATASAVGAGKRQAPPVTRSSGAARAEIAAGPGARARRVRGGDRTAAAARLRGGAGDPARPRAQAVRRGHREHPGRPARGRPSERAVPGRAHRAAGRASRRCCTTPAGIGICWASSPICWARTPSACATCCSSPAIPAAWATIPTRPRCSTSIRSV